MQHQYTLFVDEAGDDKVERLKPDFPNGNSEWLCLGGYLVRTEYENELEERRNSLITSIGGQSGQALHFRNYNSKNRAKICRGLAAYRGRAFVVCSYKKTMLGYRNPRAEAVGNVSSNRQHLYNFVTRLLLERVTEFVAADAKEKNIAKPKLRIVMASRRGHHFGHFKAYVLQLIHQATAGSTFLDTRVVEHSVLSYNLIERCSASSHPGLQLADAVVSSVFQSIEQNSPHYGERPAELLRCVIAGKSRWSGGPLFRNNMGLTIYPAKKAANMISEDQKKFFANFDYDFEWINGKKINPRRFHAGGSLSLQGPERAFL